VAPEFVKQHLPDAADDVLVHPLARKEEGGDHRPCIQGRGLAWPSLYWKYQHPPIAVLEPSIPSNQGYLSAI